MKDKITLAEKNLEEQQKEQQRKAKEYEKELEQRALDWKAKLEKKRPKEMLPGAREYARPTRRRLMPGFGWKRSRGEPPRWQQASKQRTSRCRQRPTTGWKARAR